MQRLSRAEQQLRNRARVVIAARAEFTEHGYRYATIDGIAARANLTRGAVYSNFPGKRALYFATLTPTTHRTTAETVADALAAYASAYLLQQHPGLDLVAELTEFDTQYVGLLNLNAVLLGLELDRIQPGNLGRMIAIARQAHTVLAGAVQLAATPGFIQPAAVAETCAHLATLDPVDSWKPSSKTGAVMVLGLNRLTAIEDAVRTTTGPVTVVLVTSEPAELGPIARYLVGLSTSCLPPGRLEVRHDYDGVLAAAVGCDQLSDNLEYAVPLEDQAAISPIPSVSEPAARNAAPIHNNQIA